MHLGKRPTKLSLSWSSRRIRLGVAHHGAPSAWSAPTKDDSRDHKPQKKQRR